MTLDGLFEDLATGLADEAGSLAEPGAASGAAPLAAAEDDDGREWRCRGTTFAALCGPVAEFRLDPMIAGAALRTPDTKPSPRGPEWVAFEPSALDDLTLDRAEAWFIAAFRRAEQG